MSANYGGESTSDDELNLLLDEDEDHSSGGSEDDDEEEEPDDEEEQDDEGSFSEEEDEEEDDIELSDDDEEDDDEEEEDEDEDEEDDEEDDDEEEEDEAEDGDDDEGDDEQQEEWRDQFIQTCLQIGRNDKSLVHLFTSQDWERSHNNDDDDNNNNNNDEDEEGEDTANALGRDWNNADLVLLGRALTHNSHLRSLYIQTTICICGGKESQRGADTLRQGLAQSNLHKLELNSLCSNVLETLLVGVAQSWTLQQLTLSDTLVDVGLLSNLLLRHDDTNPKCLRHGGGCQLTHLSLKSCDISDLDMLLLATSLCDHATLVSLELNNNEITNVGVNHFCRIYWNKTTNEHEHHAGDGGNDDDKKKKTKKNCPKQQNHGRLLQVLNLSDNAIGIEGMHQLLKSITPSTPSTTTTKTRPSQRHCALHTLVLSGNDKIGYQGLHDLGEYLPFLDLQHLEIAKLVTRFDRTGASCPAARDAACQTLARGLQLNSSLRSLSMGNNGLGARGVQSLLQAIAVHPTLTRLSLVGDLSLGLKGIQQVGTMLPHLSLTHLDLDCTCIGWPHESSPSRSKSAARKAGQALLEGVRQNFHLTSFQFEELHDSWMIPIQFHVNINQTCRPLFCHSSSVTPALWPVALARLMQDDKPSHVYFSLLEQPWLVTTWSSSSSSGNSNHHKSILPTQADVNVVDDDEEDEVIEVENQVKEHQLAMLLWQVSWCDEMNEGEYRVRLAVDLLLLIVAFLLYCFELKTR